MFYECSGCQAVMSFAFDPPHVCPECGRAGILFCLLDDQDLSELLRREAGFAVSFDRSALEDGEDSGALALG